MTAVQLVSTIQPIRLSAASRRLIDGSELLVNMTITVR